MVQILIYIITIKTRIKKDRKHNPGVHQVCNQKTKSRQGTIKSNHQ